MLGVVQPEAGVADDKPALVLGDEVRTFGQLETRVEALARALVARGLAPGTPVGVMLPNGFEFMELGLATARAGLRLLPVNWHLKADEVAWIAGDAGCGLFVCQDRLLEVARSALAGRQVPLMVVGDAAGGVEDYEAVVAGSGPAADFAARGGRATPRYLYYTSGTTGRPRGVERDERPDPDSVVTRGVIAMWGFRPDDVFVESSPLYHAAGAYAFISLFAGATVVILPRFTGLGWLEAVDRHRVTTALMVPAQFIRVLEVPESQRHAFDLSSVRLVLHSAAPCPEPVKRAMLDLLPGAEITEFYGASEGGATKISSAEWLEHPGSVGRPWPGVTVTVRDDEGRELPPGRTGLIYASIPHAGARFRYHNDPDKTEAAWLGDSYTLGDVGHLDPDGYLYITDRAADMVIRGGVNIYPVEVEQVLHTHPDVVDCACFGVPDDRMGEILVALVEARRAMTSDEVTGWCRARLADFKCPETVAFVAELPRDPSGKVRKRELRERFLAGRAAG